MKKRVLKTNFKNMYLTEEEIKHSIKKDLEEFNRPPGEGYGWILLAFIVIVCLSIIFGYYS